MYKNVKQGHYKPKFPKKWKGDPHNIIYRSGIELSFFRYFESHPDVTCIGSENIVVPYFDPVKDKYRRYFVDLQVTYKDKFGKTRTFIIEIKSSGESVKPRKPKRLTESYKKKVLTYITNNAKWEAATKYANKKGWKFLVLTEKDLK